MQRVFICLQLFFLPIILIAQNDTSIVRRVTAFSWLPNGSGLLLNIVQGDKTQQARPLFKKFIFYFKENSFVDFPLKESGISIHPDGKSAAYIKKEGNLETIYVHDLLSKKDNVLVKDSLKKFSVHWTPDGNKIVYNIEYKINGQTALEIYSYDLLTKRIKKITDNFPYYSRNPSWNPKDGRIVYFLEKGDQHDQIYLTDSNGSFHTNLTKDTGSHFYNPSWIDQNTVLYTKSPASLVIQNLKNGEINELEGIVSTLAKYNSKANKIAYMEEEVGRVYIYDYKRKKSYLLIDSKKLKSLPFN